MSHGFYSGGAVVSEQQSKWKDSIHLARATLCRRCSCIDLSSLMPYCCTTILSVSVYEDSHLCILNKINECNSNKSKIKECAQVGPRMNMKVTMFWPCFRGSDHAEMSIFYGALHKSLDCLSSNQMEL